MNVVDRIEIVTGLNALEVGCQIFRELGNSCELCPFRTNSICGLRKNLDELRYILMKGF